jgi:hypothetical protein
MKHRYKRNFTSIALVALVLGSLCAVSVSTLSVTAAQSSSGNTGPLVRAPVAGAPAVCSQDGATLDLFVRGANSALYWKHWDGTTWSASVSLGGICTSNPAAVSPGKGVLDVFVRGSDGALYERATTNAGDATPTWTWSKIGGQLLAGTGPTAYTFGIRVGWFVTGNNHALYQQWSDGGAQPVSWKNLGGYLTSGPAATALSDGSQIGVIVGGTSGVLYYKHYSAGVWESWVKIGGHLLAGTSPAAYNWGPVRIGWFVTGTDSALYHMWSGTTTGWENLGGVLTSSPGATAKAPYTIDVFARGGNGDFTILWQRSYSGGQWGDWTYIGGV